MNRLSPYILVTIDTEEDMPDWKPEPVPRSENIKRLPMLHHALQKIGIRPTYLVSKPVLDNEVACSILQQLQKDGDCEVGMHLHAWNSPPILSEEASGKATVLTALPAKIQREKLHRFYAYFCERFGSAPTSYRAGRYGLSAVSVEVLAELGFEADSSVVPLHDFSAYGAPDYNSFGASPFWMETTRSVKVLEVPITAGLVTRLPQFASGVYFAIPHWTHLRGVMHRLNIARLIWLRPTTYSFFEMRQLAHYVMESDASPVLNLMFHSSELLPGASAYNRNGTDVERFMDRLMQILCHLVSDCGGVGVTLTQLARLFKDGKELKCLSKTVQL